MTSTTHSTDGEEPDAEARVIMDNIHRGDLPADDFLTHEDVGEPPQAPDAEVAEIAKRQKERVDSALAIGRILEPYAVSAVDDVTALLRLLASRQPGLTEETINVLARVGYEKAVEGYYRQSKSDEPFLHRAWEKQTPELKSEWANIVRAIIGRLTGQPAGET